jgi:hypothetical protein
MKHLRSFETENIVGVKNADGEGMIEQLKY